MKFVGHKKLKKQQLGHGAFGDTITVMTSYLQGGGEGGEHSPLVTLLDVPRL